MPIGAGLFCPGTDEVADLFLCDADGWWEFYCGRGDWIDRLISPGARSAGAR